jgi:hypothetical protein
VKEQIRQLLLKVLLAHDAPLAESVLKSGVRKGLAAAVTDGDLVIQIQWLEQEHLIIGTSDGVVGTEWTLTTAGKLKAAQLK